MHVELEPSILKRIVLDASCCCRPFCACGALALGMGLANPARDVPSFGILVDNLQWRHVKKKTDGRDHNPFGFTVWMAGGGIRGGMTLGSTDEFGYRAVERPLEIHDLHATMLHLLGIDHERLVMEHGGRAMRLTDVHGHVVHEIIA